MTERSQEADAALSNQLETLIEDLPEDKLSVKDLIERCGQEGLLLLSALLTLVFLIPVSLPGVSTVFGAVILLVGISRLRNGPLWLPKRVEKKTVTVEKLRPALERGLKWVRRLEKVSRSRRLPALADSRIAAMINNLAFIIAALMLMAPFGFVPLSNTLPGIALLFYAIGLAQRDGIAILLGHLTNIATVIYFGVLIGGGGVAIKNFLT
jgi:Uncharacterized ABC-type transport system, permease components